MSKSRRGALIAALLSSSLGVAGCGDSGPTPGTERGACYPNGTCNSGLTCLSHLCVVVDVDGAADAAEAGPDDAGANDGPEAGDASDASDAADGGEPEAMSTPAPHPRLPQVSNFGGPVLEHPRVQPIYYAGDPEAAGLDEFLQELTRTSYWEQTTAEYGVGPLLVAPTINLPGPAPTAQTDDTLAGRLADNLSGLDPVWGRADPSTIYTFVMPRGSTVSFSDGQTCCSGYGGYHYEATTVEGVTVPYAVICSCSEFQQNLSSIEALTTLMSHQLINTATNPFPLSAPANIGTDRANVVWYSMTGGETADMCGLNPDTNVMPPGSKYMVKRSWSNAAARASRNPCVPAPPNQPYFNAYAALSTLDIGAPGAPYVTQAVQVPLGQSKTIDVVLSSDGPPSLIWDVFAFTYEDVHGGDTTNLGLALNPARGKNGDVLHLTISPRRRNPTFSSGIFILVSRHGSGASLQTNLSMGVVSYD